jgi:hypothetical protein
MHTPDEGDSPLTSEYQGELVVEEAEAQVPQESPPPGNDEEYDLAPDFLPQGNEADHDRGILALLRENLHEPYGPPSGSKPTATVLQECYFKARMKIEHNQTNQALELELNRNSRAVGEPNHYPRSLYLMEKCLGIEHPDMYERHVCVNDHHLFPHARPWQYDAAEVCTFPGCGELRYKNVGTVKDSKLKARKASSGSLLWKPSGTLGWIKFCSSSLMIRSGASCVGLELQTVFMISVALGKAESLEG